MLQCHLIAAFPITEKAYKQDKQTLQRLLEHGVRSQRGSKVERPIYLEKGVCMCSCVCNIMKGVCMCNIMKNKMMMMVMNKNKKKNKNELR